MTDASGKAADLERVRAKYRAERDKRVDPNRAEILDPATHAELLDDPYSPVVPREPKRDEVDAVVVGGGFGGLISAAELRKQGLDRIRIIEKAGDVGGVWYWNRYPGAMCDVESYVYLPMLEELNYIPAHRYSYAPEIYAYTKKLAKHFGLYDLALFHTAVTGMSWDADAGRWTVTTDRGDEISARYVVVAHGSFSTLKLPAIEGIDGFEGKIFHTSRWEYDYTGGGPASALEKLGDKTVGVIGTGATAVQIVAPLAESAEQLLVFQRTPSTIGVRDNAETDPEWAGSQEPGWQKRRRDNFTSLTNGDKVTEDLVGDGWTIFYNTILDRPDLAEMSPEEVARERELIDFEHMETIRGRIDAVVSDPAVAEALKPYYRYWCKRPCFHDEYLASFNRPNVRLVDSQGKGVERVTTGGVVVGGVEYPVDCLILATGFDQDSSYVGRIGFDIAGIDGVRLSDKWADGPETFHGIMTSGFPNLFLLPPNNTQGTASINFVHGLQETGEHIAYVIGELDRRGVLGDASKQAEDEYVDHVIHGSGLSLLGSGDFLKNCTPGRWNNEGDPLARPAKNVNYPGTSDMYFGMLEKWRRAGELEGLRLIEKPAPVQAARDS